MRTLSIDIETYSSVDLIKYGAFAYADAPDFEILLFAYAFDDDEEVSIVDLAQGEEVPEDVMCALVDRNVIKTAFNAQFEMTCISKYLAINLVFHQWQCTAVQSRELGLAHNLEGVCVELGLPQSYQKDSKGKALIRKFCVPCSPTKANGGRTRNLPYNDIENWNKFKGYCKQDVVAEIAVKKAIAKYPLTASEQELWELDQRINSRGVGLHIKLASNATECYEKQQIKVKRHMQEITGLDNPSSVAQLKNWVSTELGEDITSLDKASISNLIKDNKSSKVTNILKLKESISKTSTKKYASMLESVCSDGRIRGITQFYGASRTGRWAGRIFQPQNLPRNYLYDLNLARNLVIEGEYETLDILFGNTADTLSQLVRTAIIPKEGCRFLVSDFSAIEARVLAYLANEKWRLEVFKTHGKIYEASASAMFKVPIEEIGKDSPLRQKGKIAELALGYGGGVGAIVNRELTQSEIAELVCSWRKANPHIKDFWRKTEKACINAIKGKPSLLDNGIRVFRKDDYLFIKLPQGRYLSYAKPKLSTNTWGKPTITYMGAVLGKRDRIETWGGKLVENITQAVARDCLAESMRNLEQEGYRIVFHVHDEVIIEEEKGKGSIEDVNAIMSRPLKWAKGLPLKAEGYECEYYLKA